MPCVNPPITHSTTITLYLQIYSVLNCSAFKRI